MRLLLRYSCLVLILFLFDSCANYKLNYTSKAESWRDGIMPTSDQNLKHSVFLIGDAGNTDLGEAPPLLGLLKKRLEKAGKESSIVFLGDNIYPVGMPSKEDPFRPLAEHKLNVQLNMLDDYPGNIMFMPGNHDWYSYGTKGIKRQEKYIEKYLNKLKGIDDKDDKAWKDYFLPGNACGDPYTVEINDQLVIVIIDSAWWLRNWNKDQNINAGCEIKSRSFFKFQFEETVRKHRNKNVILAMHHPLFSNGPHGGHFTIKEHIFPLTPLNKNLYIPLPGIGTIASFVRASIGIPEDLANSKYKAFISDVLAGLTKNGNYIVASGHEHNLQYIEKLNQTQIVSGAGSKENPTTVGGGGEFGYGRKGFSKVDFYEDGQAWVSFFALNEAEDNLDLVFKKKIKDKLKMSKDNIPTTFPEYDKKESVVVRKPNNYDLKEVSGLHKATLGDHYLDEYMKDYPFDVLDLETFAGGLTPMKEVEDNNTNSMTLEGGSITNDKEGVSQRKSLRIEGGLTPIKRGGGNQTNSLRLKDENGRQYTLRSLTKDASRALPYPANQVPAAEKILKDNFLSAYPFAASIVPKMADAANVYHANPHLFYVPKQPRLGLHNDIFGDDVYLLEERVGGNWDNQPSLGSSKKIISTLDVSEKIRTKHKYRVDHAWLVRSRLFDIVIQDWDRHDDQWRWATVYQEDGKLYRPIPRDRDQAFSRYDGFVMRFLGASSPFFKSLQDFKGEVKDIRWASWNGKYFDTNFLGEADREDWLREAKFIQENVTDEVIQAAFSDVPLAAQNERWKSMMEKVKTRRNDIVKYAEQAYRYNSLKVDVLGTAQKDYFEVIREENQTRITGYALKKGEKGKVFYERVFDNDVTKEISIYGFEGKDIFDLSGKAKKGIKIRIIGGLNRDEVIDKSYVSKGGKKTLYYDSSEKKNKMALGREGKDKTSGRVDLNAYERKNPQYQANWTFPFPRLGYTEDEGLNIGISLTRYRYKFKKAPFGESHNFIIDYATEPGSINLEYNGLFIETIGSWNLRTQALYHGGRTSFNFFGFGNDSENIDPDDNLFNRVGQSRLLGYLGLEKDFAQGNGNFSIGPVYERTEIEEEGDRITGEPNSLFDFDDITYAGVRMNFDYASLDSKFNPRKGVKFGFQGSTEQRLNDSGNDDNMLIGFQSNLNLYIPLVPSKKLALATKFNYGRVDGTFDFFKAPTLGGSSSLRGFRQERFRGESVFSHMTDIRVDAISNINSVVPFALGFHAGFDYGRVFVDGAEADDWNYSYGGGIFISPLNAIVISAGYYLNEEDEQIIVKLGHMF